MVDFIQGWIHTKVSKDTRKIKKQSNESLRKLKYLHSFIFSLSSQRAHGNRWKKRWNDLTFNLNVKLFFLMWNRVNLQGFFILPLIWAKIKELLLRFCFYQLPFKVYWNLFLFLNQRWGKIQIVRCFMASLIRLVVVDVVCRWLLLRCYQIPLAFLSLFNPFNVLVFISLCVSPICCVICRVADRNSG